MTKLLSFVIICFRIWLLRREHYFSKSRKRCRFWQHIPVRSKWTQGVMINSLCRSEANWRCIFQVNIGPGKGMLTYGTIPLPKPLLIHVQWGRPRPPFTKSQRISQYMKHWDVKITQLSLDIFPATNACLCWVSKMIIYDQPKTLPHMKYILVKLPRRVSKNALFHLRNPNITESFTSQRWVLHLPPNIQSVRVTKLQPCILGHSFPTTHISLCVRLCECVAIIKH